MAFEDAVQYSPQQLEPVSGYSELTTAVFNSDVIKYTPQLLEATTGTTLYFTPALFNDEAITFSPPPLSGATRYAVVTDIAYYTNVDRRSSYMFKYSENDDVTVILSARLDVSPKVPTEFVDTNNYLNEFQQTSGDYEVPIEYKIVASNRYGQGYMRTRLRVLNVPTE